MFLRKILYGIRGTIVRSMVIICIPPLTITTVILFYFVNNYAKDNAEKAIEKSIHNVIDIFETMNNDEASYQLLGKMSPAGGGFYFAMDQNGTLLVHPIRKGETDTLLLETIKGANGVIETEINHDGNQYLVYRELLPEKNIYLGAARLKSDTQLLQKGFAFVLLGLIVATPFILFIISMYLARSVRNPLKKIIDVAELVSTGDLSKFITQPHYRKCTQMNGCDKPDCPAFSTSNLACWGIQGTLCYEGMENMEVEEKVKKYCCDCKVYRNSIRGEFDELIEAINNMIVTTQHIVSSIKDVSSKVRTEAENLAETTQRVEIEMQNQAGYIEETTSSNEELAASIDSIASAARKQADKMTSTNSAMEKLSAASTLVNDKAINVSNKTKDAVGNANATKAVLDNTTSKMNQISDNSQKIVEIVQIINDISDQINLLSLNASIEAARAGEHGRGFAIVAEEISKLADATASSTKEIEKMIQQTRTDVGEGATLVNTTNDAIVQVINNINITARLIEEITASSAEQKKGNDIILGDIETVNQMSDVIAATTAEQKVNSNEILKALSNINESIQVMTHSSANLHSSAEKLKDKSEELNNITGYFKVKR